jgi:hypothetical protein
MPDNVENQGIAIPGEASPTPIEDRARQAGWRPQEEWNGNPEDWIDAKEFVGRQPLFDKIKDLKGEVHGLKKDVGMLANNYRQIQQTAYQRALEELTSQRKQAAKEGDTETVVELSDKIEELKEDARKAPPPAPDVPQEFKSWVDKNSWYNNDTDLRADADAFGISFRAKNPSASLDEMLQHVEERIKRTNPEKFPTAKRPSASAVEGGTSPVSRSRGAITEADLSDVERSVMNTLVKRGEMTKKDYLESYNKKWGKG